MTLRLVDCPACACMYLLTCTEQHVARRSAYGSITAYDTIVSIAPLKCPKCGRPSPGTDPPADET